MIQSEECEEAGKSKAQATEPLLFLQMIIIYIIQSRLTIVASQYSIMIFE